MKPLKKVISLHEASKISGYNQDYLGSLIRKGELKATKVGRNYFTTEEAINNYIFIRKIDQKEWAFGHFFSARRVKKIITMSFLLLIAMFFVFLDSTERNYQPTETPATTLDIEVETLTEHDAR